MNGQPENLREAFLDAVFQGGSDVVDFTDGQAAVHRAMAGDDDLVVHTADVHFMAIDQLVILGLK